MPAMASFTDARTRIWRTVASVDESDWEKRSAHIYTRTEVLANLVLHTEGLVRVVDGLRAGKWVPQYGADHFVEFEELSAEGSAAVVPRMYTSTRRFEYSMAGFDPAHFGNERFDTSPDGRHTLRVADIPLLQLIALELCNADLATEYGPADWPAEVPPVLLDRYSREHRLDAFTVAPTDVAHTWEVPGRKSGEVPVVSGKAADLAWWLAERGNGEGVMCSTGGLPVRRANLY